MTQASNSTAGVAGGAVGTISIVILATSLKQVGSLIRTVLYIVVLQVFDSPLPYMNPTHTETCFRPETTSFLREIPL